MLVKEQESIDNIIVKTSRHSKYTQGNAQASI